jgi:small subunit ribosomal protein S1
MAVINRFREDPVEKDPELMDLDSAVEIEDGEDFKSLYADSLKNVIEGEVVMGRVVSVEKDGVLVDIGYKSEGIIPMAEFNERNPDAVPKVGEEVEVYLERTEDAEGRVVLSKQKVDKQKIWSRLYKAFENKETLEGIITRRIKGGLVIDINGVDCFLPASQVALRPTSDLDQFNGQKAQVRIIKFNRGRGNVVASRRVLLEEEREKKRDRKSTRLNSSHH